MIDGMQRTLKESLEMRHEEDDSDYLDITNHGDTVLITKIL